MIYKKNKSKKCRKFISQYFLQKRMKLLNFYTRTFHEVQPLLRVSGIVPFVLSSYSFFLAFLLPLSPSRISRRPVSSPSTLEVGSADQTLFYGVLFPKYWMQIPKNTIIQMTLGIKHYKVNDSQWYNNLHLSLPAYPWMIWFSFPMELSPFPSLPSPRPLSQLLYLCRLFPSFLPSLLLPLWVWLKNNMWI